ncbi:MAG: hypothetical protein PHE99_04975 [Bacteroidales bacterium]|nr:hypothetical protein [Bacteroidales bacterium]
MKKGRNKGNLKFFSLNESNKIKYMVLKAKARNKVKARKSIKGKEKLPIASSKPITGNNRAKR